MRFGGNRAELGMPVEERFWSKVDKSCDCWIWQGTLHPDGYGRFHADRRAQWAHRYAYELLVEPIPPGLVIDHLCRNRACVNPEHMEPVSNVENVLRGESPAARAARSDRCAKGHLLTPENTYIEPSGWRRCRTCRRERINAA